MLVSLCTMLVSADHGHVALQLHLLATLPCFFRSRYVRAATCCRFHKQKKWFPSLQYLMSKSLVISTWLSIESALPGVFVDFSGARELPPPRYGCRRPQLFASPRGINFPLIPVAQTQSPSTSRRISLKPCRLQSCHAQELCST